MKLEEQTVSCLEVDAGFVPALRAAVEWGVPSVEETACPPETAVLTALLFLGLSIPGSWLVEVESISCSFSAQLGRGQGGGDTQETAQSQRWGPGRPQGASLWQPEVLSWPPNFPTL